MRSVYEASNSLEGHMIVNLLDQEGITARIDGEYLQGGVGELQALGYIRVMVDEEDYHSAKDIVTQWDQQQIPPTQYSAPKNKNAFLAGLVGFVIGGVFVAALYATPVTSDGIDYDGDGVLDEKWTYVNNRMSTMELDRNRDGKVDSTHQFNRLGLLLSSQHDDNFDGSFETDIQYNQGNVERLNRDTTGDGRKNYREEYKNGVLARQIFISPTTGLPAKVAHYNGFTLSSAELDTDADGILDTVYEYNEFEEIIIQRKR